MATIFKIRRDTSTNWTTHNPILAEGEMGLDQTNNFIKMGDGTTAWNSLPQFTQNIENVEDLVGAMVSGNTENGIVVTYDDATGKLNFDVGDPNLSISGDATATAIMTDLGNTNLALTLADTAVTPGSYGSASLVPVITVDSKGRLTSAGTTAVAGVDSVAYDTATGVITINTSDGGSHTVDIDVGTNDSPTFAGLTTTDDIVFGDNDQAKFGTGVGGDLSIYHSGTHSYILEAGTGDLKILAQNNLELGQHNGDVYFRGTTDGAASLWYNGGKKLETHGMGVNVTNSLDVTGNITVAGTVDGRDIALDESNATTDRALIRTEVAANETARDTSEATAISNAINALVDSAPGTLDTLNELAAAIGDDANHLTTMTSLISSNETARDTSIAAQEVLNATARTNIQDDVDANELAAGLARTAIQDDVDANELASDTAHTAATTDRALIRTEVTANETARDSSIAAQVATDTARMDNIQTDINTNESDSDTAHTAATTDRALIRTELSTAISTEVTDRNTAIGVAVGDLVDSAPGALDTLNELAASLGDDANYAATVTTALGVASTDRAAIRSEMTAADTAVTSATTAAIAAQEVLSLTARNAIQSDVDANELASDTSHTAATTDRALIRTEMATNESDRDSSVASAIATQEVLSASARSAIQSDVDANESAQALVNTAATTDRAAIRSEVTANETARDSSEALAISTAITDLIGGAPGTLDTLNELAAAINDDNAYASTLTTSLATKVNKTSNQALSNVANAMTISGHTITLNRGDSTTDTVTVPDNYVDSAEYDITTSTLTLGRTGTLSDLEVTIQAGAESVWDGGGAADNDDGEYADIIWDLQEPQTPHIGIYSVSGAQLN